jgi:hypothetical protein
VSETFQQPGGEGGPPPPGHGRGEEDGAAGSDYFLLPGVCVRGPDGTYTFGGVRPGEAWVGHGYFSRQVVARDHGKDVQVSLQIHRWRRRGTRETVSTPPPGILPRRHYGAVLIVALLYGWLLGRHGLLHARGPLAARYRPAARTLQRWRRRATSDALRFHQALRELLLDRCEPRPADFDWEEARGPPPGGVSSDSVRSKGPLLRKTLAVLWHVASSLSLQPSQLLAGARGRCLITEHIFPLG